MTWYDPTLTPRTIKALDRKIEALLAEIARLCLAADTFERQYRQACQDHAEVTAEVKRLRAALAEISEP